MSARAATSEIASVNDDAYAPRIAVSSFWVIRRWATAEAAVGFESRVADDQVDPGAAERLDAPRGVDRVGNELDAVRGN